MAAPSTTETKRAGNGLLAWLGSVVPGRCVDGPPSDPAVTRSEIALWLAEAVAEDITQTVRDLGRPGVVVVRCRFPGFQDDLRLGLEHVLRDKIACAVFSAWPTDADEARSAARETIDALNAGRTRIFVLPHERILVGMVPSVDAALSLPRFSPQTLAQACHRFYELTQEPVVPAEPWVGQVCPSDFLISSAVSGDPIPAIRDAARRRLREYACDDATPLESLMGLNEVRAWAAALIEDIQDALDPQIRCQWADIERAVVLVGLRGVGRTSLSRAIAKASGLHWVKVSARRWAAAQESERWQSAADRRASLVAMEEDFDQARDLAPSMLFIEDLGSLSPELVPVLGRLIAGSDSANPVIVVASASDADLPNEEALRAANFEHTAFLPLPSSQVLSSALLSRLSGIQHDLADAQVQQVGRLVLGGTAADLDLYIRRAQKIARRSGNRPMRFDDLAVAILETPAVQARPRIKESELKVTAFHEAGHAVANFIESSGGVDLQFVTIVPRRMDGGTALGFVLRTREEDRFSMSRAEGLARIRGVLGGRAAEELLLGRDHVSTGAGGSQSSDLAKATKMATHLIGLCGLGDSRSMVYRSGSLHEDIQLARQVDTLLRKQYRMTIDLLRTHWHLVDALADHLMAKQELSGDEVRAILKQTGPPASPARARTQAASCSTPALPALHRRSTTESPHDNTAVQVDLPQ